MILCLVFLGHVELQEGRLDRVTVELPVVGAARVGVGAHEEDAVGVFHLLISDETQRAPHRMRHYRT